MNPSRLCEKRVEIEFSVSAIVAGGRAKVYAASCEEAVSEAKECLKLLERGTLGTARGVLGWILQRREKISELLRRHILRVRSSRVFRIFGI